MKSFLDFFFFFFFFFFSIVKVRFTEKNPNLLSKFYVSLETYGKPCESAKVYQCSQNEMCTYNKTCVCLTGMVINPFSGYCDKPGE